MHTDVLGYGWNYARCTGTGAPNQGGNGRVYIYLQGLEPGAPFLFETVTHGYIRYSVTSGLDVVSLGQNVKVMTSDDKIFFDNLVNTKKV